MTFPDQGLTPTAEYIAGKLRESAETEGGTMLLSVAAIGMGHMMGKEGESGEMSRKFLDAIVVLGQSPNGNDKILAVQLGMLFRQGKRAHDEEAGLFVLPSQPAGE